MAPYQNGFIAQSVTSQTNKPAAAPYVIYQQIGLHIHLPNDLEPVRQLGRAGKLLDSPSSMTPGSQNEMVQHVHTHFAHVTSDHDNPVQNYQEYGADLRVIYHSWERSEHPNAMIIGWT